MASSDLPGASLQQAVGYVGGTRRTLRWAESDGSPVADRWIHAEDICNALGWQRPGQTLRALRTHVKTASELGIQCGTPCDRFINKAGVTELFARRTGGVTHKIKSLVHDRIYDDPAFSFESDAEDAEPLDPQEEPMIPAADVAAMELAAQRRHEATLAQAQALKARAQVLAEYCAMGGNQQDAEYQSACATLLAEMKRPYPSQFISTAEYIQFQGFSENAALQFASVFGPDLKRAYKASRGKPPTTFEAVFPGCSSPVSLYDRYQDAELLGSCWRNFQAARPWYQERYQDSEQRRVDLHHLECMRKGADGKPASGWGAARTRALRDRRS